MVHQEDAVHRIYYALHIGMSFVMSIAIEHPDYSFFNFKKQSFFLSISSILTRMVTVFMWSFTLYNDNKHRSNPDFKPGYDRKFIREQIPKHVAGILVACVLFAVTAGLDWAGDPDDETRRLAGASSEDICDDHRRRLGGGAINPYTYECVDREKYSATITLWIFAVLIEQVVNTYCTIYDRVSLPCCVLQKYRNLEPSPSIHQRRIYNMKCDPRSLIGSFARDFHSIAASVQRRIRW